MKLAPGLNWKIAWKYAAEEPKLKDERLSADVTRKDSRLKSEDGQRDFLEQVWTQSLSLTLTNLTKRGKKKNQTHFKRHSRTTQGGNLHFKLSSNEKRVTTVNHIKD